MGQGMVCLSSVALRKASAASFVLLSLRYAGPAAPGVPDLWIGANRASIIRLRLSEAIALQATFALLT